MLTPYTQSKFVEKVFTDESGRQFKLVFFVALVNGEIKARLVSAKPVVSSVGSDPVALLAPVYEYQGEREVVSDFSPVVSPYLSLEYLLSSQPTRAPSHI